jgi:hypothetical protein
MKGRSRRESKQRMEDGRERAGEIKQREGGREGQRKRQGEKTRSDGQ